MILDETYFVGPVTIAQLGQASVKNDLLNQIAVYEPQLLQSVLGYELYDAMTQGLSVDPIDSKWTDLRDGAVFNLTTNFPGWFPDYLYRFWYMNQTRKVRWVGLSAKPDSTISGISPLTAYVYWKYMRNLETQATGGGIVKSDQQNAIGGVSYLKMKDAWNQMCDDLSLLWFFLAAKGTGVYPQYDYRNIDFRKFQKLNLFNL